MKYLLLSVLLGLTLIAQNYPNDKKIDMHGGNYNSLGGYSSGGFHSKGMNMSSFLDKNSSKKMKKKDIKTKDY